MKMKKTSPTVKIALVVVLIGFVFQLMESGLFGEDPIPGITKYHQIIFWGGIAVWAVGQMRKDKKQKDKLDNE